MKQEELDMIPTSSEKGGHRNASSRTDHHRTVSVSCEVVRVYHFTENESRQCWDITRGVSHLLFDDDGPKNWKEFHAYLNNVAGSGVAVAAFDIDNGRLMGVQLMMTGEYRSTLIGTFVRKEAMGNGLALRILEKTLTYAGKRVTATVFAHNKGCLNFSTKRLGLKIEGVMKGHVLQDGKPVDLVVLGMLR